MPIRALVLALLALLAAVLAAAPAPAAAAAAPTLRAGAGQADLTPPRLGYVLGGWTRADRVARGQSTRLYANTLVLQRGQRKVALVAAEVFAIPAGLQEDVARAVADLGYDRTSVLLAASHTHSGPGGFFNNPTYNTTAPSAETISDPGTFARFFTPSPADRQLYTFLVGQIASSIRRADADRAPAAAAWGETQLHGVTRNRSVEAHLRNHGIVEPFGGGHAEQDPGGADHTIDPQVAVLRVDKVVREVRRVRGRRVARTTRVPIGGYSQFANHGTVVKSEEQLYSGDHHAAAWRLFADQVRKASRGRIPKRQTVVNVYPNGAEGDQSAGLDETGLDGARRVGAREAAAMLEAWRSAGRRLARRPALDVRWTRACLCNRQTATGPVDAEGREGIGFLTGSEEGRGPLFDVTRTPLEGTTNPIPDPVHGHKVIVPAGDPPPALPFTVVRIGDGVIASVPAEPTKEVGVRIREAVLAPLRSQGVSRAVIAGLAGDFVQYVVTPEEYDAQHYEGASTVYGRSQATFFTERLAELAAAMAAGGPAPEPAAFDASYGVAPDGPAYPTGAADGSIAEEPGARFERGETLRMAWQGGPDGTDRPVDRPFVSAQRKVGRRWRTVDTDLALDMVWRVGADGRHTVEWRIPRTVPAGRYRMRITASRYELRSRELDVR